MPTFGLTIVTQACALDDEEMLDRLWSEEFVIQPAVVDGLTTIRVEVDASAAELAVKRAVDHVLCAGVTPVRVDLELVNATEIAENLSVSRQAVAHWAAGKRGDHTFPTHHTVVAGSKLWTWSDVRQWAVDTGRLDGDTPVPLTSSDVSAANVLIKQEDDARCQHRAFTDVDLGEDRPERASARRNDRPTAAMSLASMPITSWKVLT